ncbi:hypothetical protein C9374_004529 [Naegleria lovaniensis]|uniref:Uncharacterized protein n=1 Tax=Naegleria lovaniensis TaxID=51637 RepID=A0AA88KJG6_NAELO|nr:uncharacterized protein C9374_004529 [Naegleria lovaniensis]KAG2383192.1 hypothetical protein C9374_004529 [Naegleria lovaniensis]
MTPSNLFNNNNTTPFPGTIPSSDHHGYFYSPSFFQPSPPSLLDQQQNCKRKRDDYETSSLPHYSYNTNEDYDAFSNSDSDYDDEEISSSATNPKTIASSLSDTKLEHPDRKRVKGFDNQISFPTHHHNSQTYFSSPPPRTLFCNQASPNESAALSRFNAMNIDDEMGDDEFATANHEELLPESLLFHANLLTSQILMLCNSSNTNEDKCTTTSSGKLKKENVKKENFWLLFKKEKQTLN